MSLGLSASPFSAAVDTPGFSFSCELRACVVPFGPVVLSVSVVSCVPGLSLQDAVGVRPLPHQRGHPGQRLAGGDPQLPGREVHSQGAHEAR